MSTSICSRACRHFTTIAIAIEIVLASSCAAPPRPKARDVIGACVQIFQRMCDREAKCCTDPEIEKSDCVRDLEGQCEYYYSGEQDLADQGSMTINLEKLKQCTTLLDDSIASCDETQYRHAVDDLTGICQFGGWLVGAKKSGALCDEDDQCAPGLVCAGASDSGGVGTCHAPIADGESCIVADFPVGCDAAMDKSCPSTAPIELPCVDGDGCDDDGDGICHPLPTGGERCGRLDCAAGFTCDEDASVCIAQQQREGAKCGHAPDGWPDCAPGFFCDGLQVEHTGDPFSGTDTLVKQGTCALPKKDGAQCESDDECIGGECLAGETDGECVPEYVICNGEADPFSGSIH